MESRTCPVCLNEYSRSDNVLPVSFSCGHSMCHGCLTVMVTISPNALCPVCRHRILSELRRKHAHLIDEKLLTRVETGAIPPPAPVQVAVSETLSLWDEIDHGLFDEIYLPPSPRNLRPRRPSLQQTNSKRRSSTPKSIAALTETPPVTAPTSRANSSANLNAPKAATSDTTNLQTTSAATLSDANNTSASLVQNPTDSFIHASSSISISTPKSYSSNSSSCSTRFTDIVEVRHRQPKTPRMSTTAKSDTCKFKTASTQISKSCKTAAIPVVAISNKFFISHEVISTDAASLDVTLNDAPNEVSTEAVSNEIASPEAVSDETDPNETVFTEPDCEESLNELAANIVSMESQHALLESASETTPSQTSKKNMRRKREPADTCVPRLTRSIAAVLTAVNLAIAAESVRVTRSMDGLETRAAGLGPPQKKKR